MAQELLKSETGDGRKLRTQKTKIAIVEALHGLMLEGNLVPTAQQLAERAGVGLRTYFRRIKSTEELFELFDDHYKPEAIKLISGGDRQGTLDQRIANVVAHFGFCYDTQQNQLLSTQTHLWRSKVVKKNYALVQKLIRENVEDFLPELKKLGDNQREAAHGIISFEMWHRLRKHQNLSKKKSIKTITMLLSLMLVDRS